MSGNCMKKLMNYLNQLHVCLISARKCSPKKHLINTGIYWYLYLRPLWWISKLLCLWNCMTCWRMHFILITFGSTCIAKAYRLLSRGCHLVMVVGLMCQNDLTSYASWNFYVPGRATQAEQDATWRPGKSNWFYPF